jgi:hypothetical protein
MTNVASDVIIIRMLQSQLNRERVLTGHRDSAIEVTTVKNIVQEQRSGLLG